MRNVLFIILMVIAVPFLCSGQKYARNAAGNFTQVKSKAKTKFTDSLTVYTLTDNKGRVFPVYKGEKGKYYIGKVSKKGKYYRQYLKTE